MISTPKDPVPDRIRVLVVTSMYPTPTNPARGAFVAAQVFALQKLGAEVEVLDVSANGHPLRYIPAVFEVRKRVGLFRPHVLFAFYGLAGWVASWQPRPLVLSLAGSDVLGSPSSRGRRTVKSRIAMVVSQWAARRACIVCVQSDEMLRRLWGSRLRRQARVVPYGVDPSRFRPGDRKAARDKLGLGRVPLVIFPNTPTERRKRIDLANAAMDLVRETIPEAELKILTGVPHDDMPDYYRAADCLLLTSDWEGSPNVVKEALLSGLPVVTTDVGDVARWVPMSPESSIVEREPRNIADAIVHVLALGRRTDPEPFRSAFGSTVIAERMMTCFCELTGRVSECEELG